MDKFYTETVVNLYLNTTDKANKLMVNDEEEKISKRVQRIIDYFRSTCMNEHKKNANIEIISFNTFPTAAGCASSASSMACLVKVLVKVFENENDVTFLSGIARLGSGSACRSMHGGIVEWQKFNNQYNSS